MVRKRRKFTKEFKAEVVRLVLDGGRRLPRYAECIA
jgi:transposase-like protein